MILFRCSDVGEYVGEYRQQVNMWYRRGKMPKPYAYTYKEGHPLWTKGQIEKWIKDKWS